MNTNTLFAHSRDLRSKLRQSPVIQHLYYGLGIDMLINCFSASWESNKHEIMKKFLTEEEMKDSKTVKLISRDIDKCYNRYKTTPLEYFLFGMRSADKEKRESYISDKVLYSAVAKTGTRSLHDAELNDKFHFYELTSEYFKRSAIEVKSAEDRAKFEQFVVGKDKVIFKPNSSACGSGIFISKTDDPKGLFDKLMAAKGDWIVEELIKQCDIMAAWNPSSVNTVRITTFKNKRGTFIHCPFIRVGRTGSDVDNGGQGGIYALVDADTGAVSSDGKDERCNIYVEHPDSKVPFKGVQIPRWNELRQLVLEIHNKKMPKHIYIGWDFALTDEGWVLIEGNWGEYVAQQSASGKGLKNEFMKLLYGK
ncbi:MAG: hypothetical protein MJZ94_01100 [Bacteroidales bacterium]|nr:hypothetical protein [Bacteroidales bacterium]